ncbi:transposase [Streptomyces sp. NBC_00445]
MVIADHHSVLVKAARKVMMGAAYPRCRVHFLRNVELFATVARCVCEARAVTPPVSETSG